jgi:hypothetical protein
VTHLPEHTTVPKIESLALLFEMTSFEENVPNFPFFGNAVCSGKDTIEQCVLANDTK